MADFLATKLSEIEKRLRELEPLIEEHARLEKAYAALAGAVDGTPLKRRESGRPKSNSKRGRTPVRANKTVELIAKTPGISTSELATKMKIHPNYLYRILPKLQREGLVKKKDKGWVAP